MSAKWSSTDLGKKSSDFGELLKDEYGVILLQGKNVFGDMIYSYLKIALPDLDKLQAALQSDESFNPSDFGTVVAAGKGEPSEEVKAEISTSYRVFEQPKPINPASPSVPDKKKKWDEY